MATTSPEQDRRDAQEIAAFDHAKGFVRDNLKSPSTADFPVTDEGMMDFSLDNGAYRCGGYVDAQNNFGAKLRERWACDVKQGKDGQWRCLSLTLDGSRIVGASSTDRVGAAMPADLNAGYR